MVYGEIKPHRRSNDWRSLNLGAQPRLTDVVCVVEVSDLKVLNKKLPRVVSILV